MATKAEEFRAEQERRQARHRIAEEAARAVVPKEREPLKPGEPPQGRRRQKLASVPRPTGGARLQMPQAHQGGRTNSQRG